MEDIRWCIQAKMNIIVNNKGEMILKVTFFLWLFAVTGLSVSPLRALQDISGKVSDKAAHFAIYFITTLLLCIAFRREKISFLIFYSGLVFLYSTAMEVVQFFLPYRDFNVGDIVANVSGILSFSFLYFIYLRVAGVDKAAIHRAKERPSDMHKSSR